MAYRELDIAAEASVGIGFITWALARDPDLLTIALERRPRAVFLSFGNIGPYASIIAGADVPLILQSVPALQPRVWYGMPGAYAILPGAFRVTVQSGASDVRLGATAMPDRSYLAGGYQRQQDLQNEFSERCAVCSSWWLQPGMTGLPARRSGGNRM